MNNYLNAIKDDLLEALSLELETCTYYLAICDKNLEDFYFGKYCAISKAMDLIKDYDIRCKYDLL